MEVEMRITTWEELQRMTPEQRRAHFEESIVWDPQNHPDPRIRAMHKRAQERAAQIIAEEEGA
jgi:hypothetical protein